MGKKIVFLFFLTAILLTAGVLMSDRMKLSEEQLAYPGTAVLFLACVFGCFAFGKDRRRKQLLMSGLLYGLVTTVTLLMIGFLWDADRMAALGVMRVSAACLGGCMTGVWLGSRRGKDRRNRSVRRP